jgi:hypothetical protein
MYYFLKSETETAERVHFTEVQRRIASGQLGPAALLATEKNPKAFRTVCQLFPGSFAPKENRRNIEKEQQGIQGTSFARTSLVCALIAPFVWIPVGLIPFFGWVAASSLPILAGFAIANGLKAYRTSRSGLGLFGAILGCCELGGLLAFLTWLLFFARL